MLKSEDLGTADFLGFWLDLKGLKDLSVNGQPSMYRMSMQVMASIYMHEYCFACVNIYIYIHNQLPHSRGTPVSF